MAEVEKVVSELKKGDVLLNLFDKEWTVVAVRKTTHERSSKWTGKPVPVFDVSLRRGNE